MSTASCSNCGAPDEGVEVHCKYCQKPYSPEVLQSSIKCPRCQVLNRFGRQQCYQCQTWVVVTCVFCGGYSPHTYPQCMHCSEAFAGAAQRKMQREQQKTDQETLDTLGTVAGIVGRIYW